MVTQIELDGETRREAERRARAEGLSLEAYLERLIRESLRPETSRDDLYAERLQRIGPDIDRAVERWTQARHQQ